MGIIERLSDFFYPSIEKLSNFTGPVPLGTSTRCSQCGAAIGPLDGIRYNYGMSFCNNTCDGDLLTN